MKKLIAPEAGMRAWRRGLASMGMAAIAACLPCQPVLAAEPPPLRVAQTGGMAYPLLVLSSPSLVSGGFLKELGDRVAEQLGTRAEHLVFSRRRIEQAVLSGSADLLCYYSPIWVKNVDAHWTITVLPQIERVVVPAGSKLDYGAPEDLASRRVAVLLGYNFTALQPLFDSGRATRVNDTQVEHLFRMLDRDMADALIVSEAEIEGFFAQKPGERARFKVSEKPFSVVDTQCLVSPRSPWSLAAVNSALQTLIKSGELAGLAQRYGLKMR
jgi:polar amino acid transport system substrate-binding protein